MPNYSIERGKDEFKLAEKVDHHSTQNKGMLLKFPDEPPKATY